MGLRHKIYYENGDIYMCSHCHTHFSSKEEVMSYAFTGQHGKAALVKRVVNVTHGELENRDMLTGLHKVRSAFCVQCNKEIGWKYEHAFNQTEKYKVGCYVLELALCNMVLLKNE
ncbi:yippee zinc-binding protein Moh1 [Ramicandelaber brevisporus]|nr:yippee zinc-binding protein Moh1 [Ramicandelaber brevisporus]